MAGTPSPSSASLPVAGPPAGPTSPSLPFYSPHAPPPHEPPLAPGGAEDSSTHPVMPGEDPILLGPPEGEDLAVLSGIADVLLGSGEDPGDSFWAFVSRRLGGDRVVDLDHGEQYEQSSAEVILDQFKVLDTSKKCTSPIRSQHKDAACTVGPSTCPVQASSRTDPTSTFSELSFSSESSEHGKKAPRNRKRKRDFAKQLATILRSLFKQAIQKQEKVQRQLIEAMEKMEKAGATREEAWRHQHVELVKREMELRMREQMVAASREQTLISFVEKISEQKTQMFMLAGTLQTKKDQTVGFPSLAGAPHMDVHPNIKRWKSCEVQELIKLKAAIEDRFQGNITKSELWEEISSNLSSMGRNWSAKECKEKWHNMTIYFKRAKAGKGKRFRDPRTSVYFRELEILHSQGALDPDAEVNDEPVAVHIEEANKENICSAYGFSHAFGNTVSFGKDQNLPAVQHDDGPHIDANF